MEAANVWVESFKRLDIFFKNNILLAHILHNNEFHIFIHVHHVFRLFQQHWWDFNSVDLERKTFHV